MVAPSETPPEKPVKPGGMSAVSKVHVTGTLAAITVS